MSSRGKRRRTQSRRPVSAAQPSASRTARRGTAGQPPRERRGRSIAIALLMAGALLGVLLLAAVLLGLVPGSGPATTDDAARSPVALGPPAATPLANPPAEPSGDGTRAIIDVPDGRIVIELFTESSPVAAENFINLAEAGFYDGILIHRIVPGFVVQMGDPTCDIDGELQNCTYGAGDPGYAIQDEPVVGEYVRGTVAMARSPQPNSQGSQFFVVLEDAPHLEGGGYAIFGRVVEGMDVVDQIVAEVPTRPGTDVPQIYYQMDRVTVERP